MSSNNDQTVISLSTFIIKLSKYENRQMHLLTDKVLRIPLSRTKMTAKILPVPIPVPTVYVLWSGLKG